MGTGAVYVTLSGIKERSSTLTTIETVFYFLNMALFFLNTLTLVVQAIGGWTCHLSYANFHGISVQCTQGKHGDLWRTLLKAYLCLSLYVSAKQAPFLQPLIYIGTGFVFRHDHNRYNKLCLSDRARWCQFPICVVLVCDHQWYGYQLTLWK